MAKALQKMTAARTGYPAWTPKKGVTLIMVAAVLSILAAMATGFYTLMLMSTRSASRYNDTVRAEMMARAGIDAGIAMIRAQAYLSTEDPASPWYTVDYLNGAQKNISFPSYIDPGSGRIIQPYAAGTSVPSGYQKMSCSGALGNSAGSTSQTDPYNPYSDTYSLEVSDAAGKININACDNLAVVLDNLCRVIGAPLVAADLDATQPRRWATEMFSNADPMYSSYATANNLNDDPNNMDQNKQKYFTDFYYQLYDASGKHVDLYDAKSSPKPHPGGRPKTKPNGTVLYGDGYAIAGYRALAGSYRSIEEVKQALTYVERSTPPDGAPNDPLEQLEIEVKFSAIRDHITVASWVDTTTVCVGKFEWVANVKNTTSGLYDTLIDRDKSWVADDPVNDPLNLRGSLRQSYLSIVNGHGSGQLRRIETNGVDWIRVIPPLTVPPGPTSSYMIIAKEEATFVDINGLDVPKPQAGQLLFPKTDNSGNLVHDPNMDYSLHPLCIHRAPVNVNTASDKVLAALFMGINVQHGHPMAIGTDADLTATQKEWKVTDPATGKPYDPHNQEAYLLTPSGLKRLPASTGKPVLDRPVPWKSPSPDDARFGYLNNYSNLAAGPSNLPFYLLPNWPKLMTCNEAHELAYRVIKARTRTIPVGKATDPDETTADAGDGLSPYDTPFPGFERGPFVSWDDLYFRAIKPWDDIRSGYTLTGKKTIPHSGNPGKTVTIQSDGSVLIGTTKGKASVARMLMAHFNPNTDVLKFNPNIEWIDRWGRNFTAMEGVMTYTNDPPDPACPMPTPKWTNPTVANPLLATSQPIFAYGAVNNQNRGTQFLRPAWLGAFPSTNDYSTLPDAGTYIIRSFRYRSDEMLDKTDLNRSTTEFSFESRGIYNIVSYGRVSKLGAVLAERKLAALVKVYDVWRETTQRQFVQGTIKAGSVGMGACGSSYSGQIVRDSQNDTNRLPLNTAPEPLVPLQYKLIKQPYQICSNQEKVDPNGNVYDTFGRVKPDIMVPDVVANKVMPASYDGQIILATNTDGFDYAKDGDEDTFLASFDGDLDTVTCLGNGHEQAKRPYVGAPMGLAPNTINVGEGYKIRCVHTCGLLGAMNYDFIDVDSGLPANPNPPWPSYNYGWDGWATDPGTLPTDPGPGNPSIPAHVPAVYKFPILSTCLRGLNPANYWENVQLRVGNLHPDGVYLTGPAVSGNNGTLKYCFGDGKTECQDSADISVLSKAKANYNPGSQDGNIVTMWVKSTWHHDDKRNHPLFDATNPGCLQGGTSCRAHSLKKHGRVVWALGWDGYACISGNDRRTDDLYWSEEGNTGLAQNDGDRDKDLIAALHGGWNWVDRFHPEFLAGNLPTSAPQDGSHIECPSYRVQPFRWLVAGARFRWNQDPGCGAGQGGHWCTSDDGQNSFNRGYIGMMARPFISTQTNPEQPDGSSGTALYNSYWSSLPNANNGWTQPCDIGDTGYVNYRQDDKAKIWPSGFGVTGQPVKWKWADPTGVEDPLCKVFGTNNSNQDIYTWIYRHLPADGAYAVIDELKISSRDRLLQATPAWAHDRGVLEQVTSRYHLPPNPADRGQCPTFTSQTMVQSLKGFNAKPTTDEYVTVARVTWTVFTPRFLHENKKPTFQRNEWISRDMNTQKQETNNFRGPFDYDKYNEKFSATESGTVIFPYGVDRPTPRDYWKGKKADAVNDYQQGQGSKGIEVEVLNNGAVIPGFCEKAPFSGQFTTNTNGTFFNPDVINRFTDANGKPVPLAKVSTGKLQYRVRFRYPVDQLVDPAAGTSTVDPDRHFLLDTPVFDDISITFLSVPRILDYKEVLE